MKTKISEPYRYNDYEVAFAALSKAQLSQGSYSALIGESGVGKTTLVRQLKPLIQQNKGIILYSSLANSSSYGLLQMVSDTLHLSARRSKQETVKMIVQTLSLMSAHLYLWLDEAHFINPAIFHEIKMLCEACLDKDGLFSTLFIGQNELLQKLKSPSLFSVMRRIDPIAEMTGLLREEISPFITACFGEELVHRFSSEALSFLFEKSVGNPAKIIRIVEKCLGENSHLETINHDIISRCIDCYFNY